MICLFAVVAWVATSFVAAAGLAILARRRRPKGRPGDRRATRRAPRARRAAR